MSLQPRTAFQIPEETQRIARAAFPQSALCLRIADALGPVYGDEQFADLFPRRGQPAETPGRLAWITVLQFGLIPTLMPSGAISSSKVSNKQSDK